MFGYLGAWWRPWLCLLLILGTWARTSYGYFYFHNGNLTRYPSHDPYLLQQSSFNVTGLALLGSFLQKDFACGLEPPSQVLPTRMQGEADALGHLHTEFDATILFFSTLSRHCDSYASVVAQVKDSWEPQALKMGYPPVKVIMFNVRYPMDHPEQFGGPYDQTADTHALNQWDYHIALYPYGSSMVDLSRIARKIESGIVPHEAVTVVSESGPWNQLAMSVAFVALRCIFSILTIATFVVAIGLMAWGIRRRGWRWDYRAALLLIGAGYSAIRIALPPIKDYSVVEDVFLHISFILGNLAYVIFSTLWVRISNEVYTLRSYRHYIYFLWFTLFNYIILVVCAFITKIMFSDKTAVVFIRTVLTLVSTPLIVIANIWQIVIIVIFWRNLRFVRIPPQFRRDYRVITILNVIVTLAFTIISISGKQVGAVWITIPSFIVKFVITTVGDTILICTIFYATASLGALQNSYLTTLEIAWNLNVVDRPSSSSDSTASSPDMEKRSHPFAPGEAVTTPPGPSLTRECSSVSQRTKCPDHEEKTVKGDSMSIKSFLTHQATDVSSIMESAVTNAPPTATRQHPADRYNLETLGTPKEPNMFASSTNPLALRPPKPTFQLKPLNSLAANKRRPTPIITIPANGLTSHPNMSVENLTTPTFSKTEAEIFEEGSLGRSHGKVKTPNRGSLKQVLQRGSRYLSLSEKTFKKSPTKD
ncbi:hypothetical protein H4R33_006464 [Dimargaris cristalligena]|uniref:Uncharacterized protein n=1 Tax=Dimargaris cristalligena TaxID=215637 RepID=A0A4P9ZPR5_9FUNG|nr:hypothetical protein H4R33_006464 [Dimargaris cristalligena]RKP34691.1 hypothetical protein BJ085DRAFT_41412 [Dimargaris cristalligena]|eukprot:RKP34691.1 hypothetical protein BJ085DRAFT_41412 [Dimargaris cristalligena]